MPLPAAEQRARDLAPTLAVITRKVLLVEDVAIDQDFVRRLLAGRGHLVDIVGDGAEAVMAVQDTVYDVVLMKVRMLYFDGLAATRMIRALAHPCRDVPIVAMTADVLPEQIAAAHAAGMIEVIHKPFSAAQIFAVLDRVVGGADAVCASAEPDGEPPACAHDAAIFGKLAALLGDVKIRSLLRSLVASLAGCFTADPTTAEGRAELRRQAHASVAGSGMLGFTAFSIACKAFQIAPDDDGFAARFELLKLAAGTVVTDARRLAEHPASLVPAAA